MAETTKSEVAHGMAQLSDKQRFCLVYLHQVGPRSTWDVCRAASRTGRNTARCSYEWADAPFRALREKGLIARTEKRDRLGRSIHALTAAGLQEIERLKPLEVI